MSPFHEYLWIVLTGVPLSEIWRKLGKITMNTTLRLAQQYFVRENVLNKKYIKWYNEMYKLAHGISRGDVNKISGNELNELQKRVDKYIGVMAKLVRKYEIDAPHPFRD